MWKEENTVEFKVLSNYLSGGRKKKPQARTVSILANIITTQFPNTSQKP